MLMSGNSIDRLMTDKVNDYILIEEQPLPIEIGDKVIYIGNFTLDNNFKFWDTYGKLLANIGMKHINFELIGNTAELFKALYVHKKLYKGLVKLIGKTILKQQAYYLDQFKNRQEIKWKNCTWSYFKKNVTMEKLLQICKLVHLYNFDAEKKNLKILLGNMAAEEEEKKAMETYMYNWLQNLPGAIGKFQLSLLTNVDYWSDVSQREVISTNRKNNGTKANDGKLRDSKEQLQDEEPKVVSENKD